MELLQEAIDRLPTELRDARWLRKQRDEYLANAERNRELAETGSIAEGEVEEGFFAKPDPDPTELN